MGYRLTLSPLMCYDITCEIRRQVGSVSGNQNQCEKPEGSSQHPSRGRPGSVVRPLLQNGTGREPQAVK